MNSPGPQDPGNEGPASNGRMQNIPEGNSQWDTNETTWNGQYNARRTVEQPPSRPAILPQSVLGLSASSSPLLLFTHPSTFSLRLPLCILLHLCASLMNKRNAHRHIIVWFHHIETEEPPSPPVCYREVESPTPSHIIYHYGSSSSSLS